MELDKVFLELKSAPKNTETIKSLQDLLVNSKQENNKSLYMEIIQYLLELLKYKKLHEEAIDLLEMAINDDFLETMDERLIIIDELVALLLKTEDFVKLKSVLFNRERYLTSNHQAIMQKFYLAVCYEGLEENERAIEYLLEIPDSIASNILVSKYLKLAMLNLKKDDISKAKKMFDMATKFDRQHKNPIFQLVMSDISYYEKDYHSALQYYQEYFIKSKNKRRYLDRFILINIALNQLDDAWRFYLEFLPVMSQIVSKNYRIVFYKAGILLAERLNNIEEVNKLKTLIQELHETDIPISNDFDSVYQILQVGFQEKTYYKERTIIHDLFKALLSMYSFQKLVYCQVVDDTLNILHYSKGLLLEKTIKKDEYEDTIFETLFDKSNQKNIYDKSAFSIYPKSLYKDDETEYIFVNEIKRDNPSREYYLVFSADLKRFDFQSRLVLLTKEILNKLLNDFYKTINQMNTVKNYKRLFDQEKVGLIKIKNNFIHFLNDYAKTIFDEDKEYFDFAKFQSHLVGKELFIDDFLKIRKEILRYDKHGQTKTLEFSVISDEFEIYAMVKDITEKSKTIEETGLMNLVFNDYPNEYELLNDITDRNPRTLMAFEIRNYFDYFKDYSVDKYHVTVSEMMSFLKDQSRNHFKKLYISSVNRIYLLLETIDKRVINRIIDSFTKQYSSSELSLFDIRITGTTINSPVNSELFLKLTYLLSITTNENKYVFDNKNFRYNQELAKTILVNIKNMIESKVVKLNYQAIGDWKTMEHKFLEVELSNRSMLGDEESLTRVIKANGLEVEWDLLIIRNLVKDIQNLSARPSFVIKLFANVIKEPKHIKKIVALLEKTNISLNRFMLIFDLEEILKLNDLNILQELKSKDIVFGTYNCMNKFSFNNFKVVSHFDYLFVTNNDIKYEHFLQFKSLLGDKKWVLVHKHETLKKSSLETLGIDLISGTMFSKYKNLSELKK